MVKKMMVATLILTLIGLLCSCLSPKESFIKKGAVLLTQKEVADTLRGNTMVALDWVAYYRKDGVRLVDVTGRETYYLKWHVDPMGRFCTQSVSGKMHCGLKLYRLGDHYKAFSDEKVHEFIIKPGNAHKIK